jgi:hypothetical protein
MVFELDTSTFWVLEVTERGGGRRGEMMVLVRTTHVRIRTEGKVGTVNWTRLRVKRIRAGGERGVVFRPQVNFFPVLSDVGEGIATDHRRVMSMVGMRGKGSLKVVNGSGDVGPGGVLTTVLVVAKVGYIWTNGVGVIKFLHERASRVWIGNLMMLLPGVMNDWVIMGIVE